MFYDVSTCHDRGLVQQQQVEEGIYAGYTQTTTNENWRFNYLNISELQLLCRLVESNEMRSGEELTRTGSVVILNPCPQLDPKHHFSIIH